MKNLSLGVSVLLLIAGLQIQAAIPDIEDGFESYAVGTNFFDGAIAGWRASTNTVIVTNSGAYRGQGIFMPDRSALTNSIAGGVGTNVIWTEVMIKPSIGDEPVCAPTNESSILCYFNTNGYLAVYTRGGGTHVCSNDVWGNGISAVTDQYVRVSIFQDYGRSNAAIFLNDQLVIQDLAFIGSAADYNRLFINNVDSNAWLDDIWIKTSRNASVLTNDWNGDGEVDSQELMLHHYVARTLYVGEGGYPNFATLQSAVDACRPRDTIRVAVGVCAETVTITSAVVVVGQAFSLDGLVVENGAVVSFAQALTLGNATIQGTLNFAAGSTCVVSTALSVGDAGLLNFASNSAFNAVFAGVAMRGGFTISNTWNTMVTRPLPFQDDFEVYADGSVMTNLAFRGWYANNGGAVVKSSMGRNSSKGMQLQAGVIVSNLVNKASASKIWTDYWITPVLGDAPRVPDTNSFSFYSYVNEAGYLVVYTNGGCRVCSNALDGSALVPMSTNGFTRVTVFQDLTTARFAVFVAGKLVMEQASFPGRSGYSSLYAQNNDDMALLDEVLITTDVPVDLPYPEAYEIARLGSVSLRGTIYCIR